MEHQPGHQHPPDPNPAANTESVVGQAPAVALSQLYLATAQALSLAAHNATAQQQHTNQLAQAATARGVAMLLGMNPADFGVPPMGAPGPPSNPPRTTHNHEP